MINGIHTCGNVSVRRGGCDVRRQDFDIDLIVIVLRRMIGDNHSEARRTALYLIEEKTLHDKCCQSAALSPVTLGLTLQAPSTLLIFAVVVIFPYKIDDCVVPTSALLISLPDAAPPVTVI